MILIDKGHSRLGWIPVSHNYPGFPDGVHGQDLLDNLRAQLERYDGQVRAGEVTRLTKEDSVFVAAWDEGEARARSVLLATGIANAGMPMAGTSGSRCRRLAAAGRDPERAHDASAAH